MVYKWKDGTYISSQVKPEIAGKCIEKIIKKKGKVTPASLLDEAKHDKHPLHDYFEWNNTIAAEKYRRVQAGYLIRHITIESKAGEDNPVSIRAFISVMSDNNKKHFTTITSAMKDPALRNQVLQKAMEDLVVWEKRYKDLKEFSSVFEAIKAVKIAQFIDH